MTNLIISHNTKKILEAAVKKPSHAYIFTGHAGLGKTESAKDFARQLLGKNITEGDFTRWVSIIETIESKKISISQMSSVKDFTNKTTPESISNKVVIIDKADKMSIEASNSLLLLLEEPPVSTVLILVADSTANIPKTIISRTQEIKFSVPSEDQISSLVSESKAEIDVAKFIGNYPARIITSAQDGHEQTKTIMAEAKNFIEGSIIDRLMISSCVSDKSEAELLIGAMIRMVEKSEMIVHSTEMAEGLIEAQLHLYNNGNPRFVMESLAMELV
jgi:hypothetical protein